MSKNDGKGLSAFELLEGLDDDMILSASLPEAAPVAPPTAGERISAFFARMGKGGMAAAIVTAVVAAAVLLGVALAGPRAVIEPSDTQPGPGLHGSGQASDSGNNPGNVLKPPVDQTPEQEKTAVTVISDGITVYPKGYCVYISEARREENGELAYLDGDGYGAVNQLSQIWDELPSLRTAGNSFDLILPENATLRSVRVFEMMDIQTMTFEELALLSDKMEDYRDRPWEFLSTLRGEYTVVMEVYYENIYSADEYTKGLDEYAFRLTVDPAVDGHSPIRVIRDDRTYFLTAYPLQTIYYDAELKQEVVKNYDGAEKILQQSSGELLTATVRTGESLSLYLAPFYDLRSVKLLSADLRVMEESDSESLLANLSQELPGDYYVIITAAFMGTGATDIVEAPLRVRVVEETETPVGDVGESPLPPRVSVGTNFGGLDFGNTSRSDEYYEGYMLWTEQWYDGGMVSGDGFGATGQIPDIADGLPVLRHSTGETPYLRVYEEEDTLTRIYVYRDDHSFYFDAEAAPILASLPVGRYIIVLRVETQGDYIEEAEAYERTCTEYAFWLDVVEERAGIPGVPETNPRVIVSGGGQSAVFETEEDGFLAWTAHRLDVAISWWPRVEGTPAASVIFTDDEAMRALPAMEIPFGTPLTLSLDGAGDTLHRVVLYSAKGETVAEGLDLSVVTSLENEGWDRGAILVLQILSHVSETEQACYEYAINLTLTQP